MDFTDYDVNVYASESEYREVMLNMYANEVRSQRDSLLAACDWVVTKAQELNQAVPQNWATYRQALRDISKQEKFPLQIAWPTKPESY